MSTQPEKTELAALHEKLDRIMQHLGITEAPKKKERKPLAERLNLVQRPTGPNA